ncbi:MAG: SDR family oxidoreductase [SAR86 cluster bacterium]|uniref:SDR family oxidoreductase n=1 Tax=SAR86 cluster bacterium TaxID=2030880 RepID=A0A838XWB7_9GAMM|nr:SDR family oxidoreductase [SAR86 cluster bacterium]|tara:strand:- start:1506 stop:2369 length:864 start_codon:yes stop_codon:yes gene_type:complete
MWDLKNKTVVISGATNGIGKAAAIELSKERSKLIFTYRNESLANDLLAEIKDLSPDTQVHSVYCDFSNQDSIKKCAEEINEMSKNIDVLINNAGVVNTSYHETSDGIENTFAVNHLGYFLFTNLLLHKLKGESETRIINVSSAAHSFVKEIQWQDINFKNNFKQGLRCYGQSKLANLLFTRYLAIKLSTENITVNAIHPGGVNTSLGSQNKVWYSKPLRLILRPFFRSPLKGAESIIYLATKQDDGVTGEYFVDSKIHKSSSYSKNLEEADKLWSLSEEMVGQTFDL